LKEKETKRKEIGSWSIILWANVECCIISSIEIWVCKSLKVASNPWNNYRSLLLVAFTDKQLRSGWETHNAYIKINN